MGWLKTRTTKVTLEKWGREDLYATFVDPTSLPYGKAKELQDRLQGLQGTDPQSADAGTIDRVLDEVLGLLDEWYITHPDTDEPMEKPKTSKDLEAFPLDVLMALMEGAMNPLGKEESSPSQSETEPEQRSALNQQDKEALDRLQAGGVK